MTTADLIAITEDLCARCLLNVQRIDAEEVDGSTVRLNLVSEEAPVLIGRNGETLFALQHMLRLMLKRQRGESAPHVIIDVDNYRRGQEESITAIARDVADRVRETGIAYEFPPMLSYKRRAIHTFFAGGEYGDLAAFSIGEGARRRVRVEPKTPALEI
jgi:spoIIIJ-associated protein